MRLKKLSIATAIALTTTVGNIGLNSDQAAANFVSEPTYINFDENVGVGSNPFITRKQIRNGQNPGPKLDNLWSDYGLNMNSTKKNGKKAHLWLYNSSCKPGENGVSENKFDNLCTGDEDKDNDLATGRGKYGNLEYNTTPQNQVLIIQENSGETAEPDDSAKGGIITFDFTDELGVDFHEIGLLDLDEPDDPVFKFYYTDGESELLDSDDSKVSVELLSTDWDGESLEKDNSLRRYDFDLEKDVTKLEITLPGSGAITELNYTRKRRVPEPSSMLGLLVGALGVVSVVKRKVS